MFLRQIIQYLAILLVPAIGAWLWFAPVFWELSPDTYTYTEAIRSAFFQSDDQEFFLGDTTDLQGTIWIFQHFSEIINGQSKSILPDIYAPIGFDLGLNTGFAWADAALAYPYVKWIGMPGFYNFHVWVTLWLNGVFLALLFRQFNLSIIVCLGLSGISIYNGFVEDELFHGRPTQIHWWFHSLLLIAFVRITHLKEQSLRWGILGGTALAAACLTYWFGGASLGFICLIIGVLYLLKCLVLRQTKETKGLVRNGVLLALVALAIALVCTWRLSLMYLQGENDQLFVGLRKAPWVEWNFLGRIVPLTSVSHIESWDDFLESMQRSNLPTYCWYLWVVTLVPIGLKNRWIWVVGSTIAIFIPLPSVFNFGEIWVPTPNAFLHWIFPPMERCGFPERLVVTPILLIGISAAAMFADIEQRFKTWKTTSFLSVGLGVGLIGLSIQEIPSSIPTSTLKADRDVMMITSALPGGIIHVPLEEAGNAFIQQMFHKQSILTGPGADTVRPTEHIEYCQQNSLLVALETLAKESHPMLPAFTESDRQKLINDGFKWIQIDLRRSKSSWQDYTSLLEVQGLHRPNRYLLALPLDANDETILTNIE